MQFKRLSLIFVASAIGVIAASSRGTSLTLDQLDLNSTTIEDEVEAIEDPTTLDPTYGKDFKPSKARLA